MDAFALNRFRSTSASRSASGSSVTSARRCSQGNTSPGRREAENRDRDFTAPRPRDRSAVALVRKLFCSLRRKRQDAALRAKQPRT
jgi:hypothetical protein